MTEAFSYARLASTSRDGYQQAHGKGPVGTPDQHSPEWADAVGKAFRAAVTSERNLLLYGSVLDGFTAAHPIDAHEESCVQAKTQPP